MQLPLLNDTIVAISSGWRASPVGIVRLSGPESYSLLTRIATQPAPASGRRCFETRIAVSADLVLPATILLFVAPRSYTGQDIVEIHTVGCLPILRELSGRLVSLGARAALPGEFTARGFLNGRVPPERIESVLALIHATDQAEGQRALRLRSSAAQTLRTAIEEQVLSLLARVEAGIDFVEEEDIRLVTPAELRAELTALLGQIDSYLEAAQATPRAARPHVALAGLPNAGKSSLFNALLGSQRAIVSPVVGTTRDAILADVTVRDTAFVLQDCAGIGESADELDLAAHRAAQQAAEQADLVLWLHAGGEPWQAREIAACARIPLERRILIHSKSDHVRVPLEPPPLAFRALASASLVTPGGLTELELCLSQAVETIRGTGLPPDDAVFWSTRSRLARLISPEGPEAPELLSLELRSAMEELREGHSPEEVLGFVFSRFCIGK